MTIEPLDPQIVDRLLQSRASGDHHPDWMTGTLNLDAALQLQLAVLDAQRANGAKLGGWKVGLTSEASRRKLGADARPFGFVRSDRVLESPATVAAADVANLSVEAEMCFTIGRDITDADITPDQVLGHVAWVSAGFELNEARTGSATPDFFSMVTDCLTNWAIVRGTPARVPDGAALSACEIAMTRNGETVFTGRSDEHVDDHALSLCCLVEQLARHGQVLRAGQRVITGAFARFDTAPGDHWRTDFSGIGSAELHVA